MLFCGFISCIGFFVQSNILSSSVNRSMIQSLQFQSDRWDSPSLSSDLNSQFPDCHLQFQIQSPNCVLSALLSLQFVIRFKFWVSLKGAHLKSLYWSKLLIGLLQFLPHTDFTSVESTGGGEVGWSEPSCSRQTLNCLSSTTSDNAETLLNTNTS